jgi:sulfur carrier protein ThiS
MHRGSSKGARERRPAPETLPLSASPGTVTVLVELTRGRSVERRALEVAPGTLVRVALKRLGQAPEGSAVLVGEVPIPLDTPIEGPMRLTVVPTFSGG